MRLLGMIMIYLTVHWHERSNQISIGSTCRSQSRKYRRTAPFLMYLEF